MEAELKKISSLVSRQFPEFYREDGDNFITFIKAYYEWMEEGGPIFKSRRLLEYSDIDEVSNEYIDNYLSKFMFGIPRKVLSDKALLEKHIHDVYRSKGSVEGLKLLFRLLYDLEILLFVPQEDMLRTSDGTWETNQYIEIEETDINHLYNKKYIKGTTSGAEAFVSSSVQIYTGLQVAHVLYIKDIVPGPSGSSFVKGEYLLTDGINIHQASLVKGSAIAATVFSSSENNTPGDPLQTLSTSGEGIIFDVSTLTDSEKLRGYLRFVLRDGGFGYSTNSFVSITQGSNTKGSGATFKVKSISNTYSFTYNTNLLNPEMDTLISAGSYGANLKLASVGSVIGNALTDSTVQIGTITSLGSISSGDHRYDGDVTVRVTDYKVQGYGIRDKKGGIWGDDSIIHGVPTTGNGVIETVELISSGFGFNDEEILEFYNTANSECSAELTIISGAIGKAAGEWSDTSGFLNDEKYIQDSDYYQEFSYEIQVEKSLDKYIDVLKQVYHPVGNKVFGRPTILDSKNLNTELIYDSVTTT